MQKIRIPTTNQVYRIETAEELKSGQEVLVEAEQILEPAIIVCDKCKKQETEGLVEAIFTRALTEEDLLQKKQLKEMAVGYLEETNKKIFRHGLDMKILDADLSFDEKKLTFYFSAAGRIDFRALVADMVGSFRKIIRLQQIGPRDEMKLFGGLGRCGQELCCKRFLASTDQINADLTGLQEIAGGKLSKMTGCCGKLMCCLSYEVEDVRDLAKETRYNRNIKASPKDNKIWFGILWLLVRLF